MDVSVIIVNYNTLTLTKQCIDSVFLNTRDVSFEIILVDNASSDGSQEFFICDNRIKYIKNKKNLGFGKANNLGLKHAKGRNIFFLNSDTYLVNDAISILSKFLDNNDTVGACGGNLYNEKMQPNVSFKRFYPCIWTELDILLGRIPSKILGIKNTNFNYYDIPIEVAYISGADLMIRKVVLDKYGAFNPSFFMYYEETELCYRIKKNGGYKIMNVPNAKIVHMNGKSSINNSKKPSQLFLDSRFTYINLTSENAIDRIIHTTLYKINYILHKMVKKW